MAAGARTAYPGLQTAKFMGRNGMAFRRVNK